LLAQEQVAAMYLNATYALAALPQNVCPHSGLAGARTSNRL